MRQILTMAGLTIVSPTLGLIYFLFQLALFIAKRVRRAERYTYSTPAQREAFELAHQERLHKVSTVGMRVL